MRILLGSFGFHPQHHGVAHVANELAVRLRRRGHEVTVATLYDPARAGAAPLEGIAVREFRIEGSLLFGSSYRGEVDAYQRFLREHAADVLLVQCWQNAITDLAADVFERIDAVKIALSQGSSVNSLWGGARDLSGWLRWKPYAALRMPRLIRSFDHVVFPTARVDLDRSFDHWLARMMGYRRISHIPNGVDVARFTTAPLDPTAPATLLCVGSFAPLKNQELLARAAEHLSEDATVIFAGGQRNEYAAALEATCQTQRAPRARFEFVYGSSPAEMAALYARATVCVLTSRTEYFPLVLLEAMAARRPFVSTDVGCAGDLPGGIVVSDPRAMGETLSRLLRDRAMAARLGEAGHRACVERYDWDQIVARYEDLFRAELARKGRGIKP
jgi:glycosyltransferase involved in cell wall biosynthesis